MKTPHYAKLGDVGIFAVVQKAKTLNIHPLDALNGGLWVLQGKVEMSSQLMNQLIRQAGHSITKDSRSDDKICILHGRRMDTQDTWTESFSIEDAKRAGIYREASSWGKYPKDMLFARALSRLARQLFPDVIKGCYVEGEIRDAVPLNATVKYEEPKKPVEEPIDQDRAQEIIQILEECPEDYQQSIATFLIKQGIGCINNLPVSLFDRLKTSASKRRDDYREELARDDVAAAEIQEPAHD
jgi:hypothetical protein